MATTKTEPTPEPVTPEQQQERQDRENEGKPGWPAEAQAFQGPSIDVEKATKNAVVEDTGRDKDGKSVKNDTPVPDSDTLIPQAQETDTDTLIPQALKVDNDTLIPQATASSEAELKAENEKLAEPVDDAPEPRGGKAMHSKHVDDEGRPVDTGH